MHVCLHGIEFVKVALKEMYKGIIFKMLRTYCGFTPILVECNEPSSSVIGRFNLSVLQKRCSRNEISCGSRLCEILGPLKVEISSVSSNRRSCFNDNDNDKTAMNTHTHTSYVNTVCFFFSAIHQKT